MKKSNSKEIPFSEEIPPIREDDVLSQLTGDKSPSLFLGRYTENEIVAVLRKRNFFKDAQKRRLWPLTFNLDSSEYPLQRLQIFYQDKDSKNLIMDLKIKEAKFRLKSKFALQYLRPEYDFLVLEWLTLQNPLQDFSPERPALPGQNHPGLSLGKKVFDIFVYLARLIRKDGLLVFPAYFHNALLFSRYFHFLNPEKEGEVLAIRKTFSDISFKQLAWIVHLNCLRWKDNKVYEWNAEEEIYPIDRALKKYFDSRAYREKVKMTAKNLRFTINWPCYKKKLASI